MLNALQSERSRCPCHTARPIWLQHHPPPRVSFQQALQHGRGVGGARLPVLDGAAEVLDAAAALPDLLELSREYLSAPLPGQARLLQAQLAHLHVVFA